MIEGFETEEAYARFNYLVDVVRGNLPSDISFDDLDPELKRIYLEEAKVTEYVVTVDDVKDLEKKVIAK